MDGVRAVVYNSGEEFELDGPLRPARDSACGVVLKGDGAFFCVGDETDEIARPARRVIEALALNRKGGAKACLGIDESVDLAAFLHQLTDFEDRKGSAVGSYVTSYEKVNRLFASNVFWHILFARGLLLKDPHFMEKPYKTSFSRVWQRVEQAPDKLNFTVESLLFLPSRSTATVRHSLPYVYSSDEFAGALGLVRSQMEGQLESYDARMTIRAAALARKVEDLLASDFVDVVYVQAPDLYQDAAAVKEVQSTLR
jgi:hypothetical protein